MKPIRTKHICKPHKQKIQHIILWLKNSTHEATNTVIQYRGNIPSGFSINSEAKASELIEIFHPYE